MLVTDTGLVWQWSVAVPPLSALPPPMAAGAGALAASLLKPRLLGAHFTCKTWPGTFTISLPCSLPAI